MPDELTKNINNQSKTYNDIYIFIINVTDCRELSCVFYGTEKSDKLGTVKIINKILFLMPYTTNNRTEHIPRIQHNKVAQEKKNNGHFSRNNKPNTANRTLQ